MERKEPLDPENLLHLLSKNIDEIILTIKCSQTNMHKYSRKKAPELSLGTGEYRSIAPTETEFLPDSKLIPIVISISKIQSQSLGGKKLVHRGDVLSKISLHRLAPPEQQYHGLPGVKLPELDKDRLYSWSDHKILK